MNLTDGAPQLNPKAPCPLLPLSLKSHVNMELQRQHQLQCFGSRSHTMVLLRYFVQRRRHTLDFAQTQEPVFVCFSRKQKRNGASSLFYSPKETGTGGGGNQQQKDLATFPASSEMYKRIPTSLWSESIVSTNRLIQYPSPTPPYRHKEMGRPQPTCPI